MDIGIGIIYFIIYYIYGSKTENIYNAQCNGIAWYQALGIYVQKSSKKFQQAHTIFEKMKNTQVCCKLYKLQIPSNQLLATKNNQAMQILRASFQNINQFAIGEICSFLIDSIVIVMQVASETQ